MRAWQSGGVANVDLQNRAPSVRVLPDFRLQVDRRYDVLNPVPKDPAKFLSDVELPLGTTDDEYTGCYLIEQVLEGQNGDFYKPCEQPPILRRTFLELNGLNETQVGEPSIEYDEDGNVNVQITYWQLNVGTSTYQTVGTTTAPAPFSTAILKDEARTNDGTLRKIVRTYNGDRTISDVSEIRFGGKVIVRTITAIGAIPPTPTGYTLVGPGTLHPNGRKIYTYQFVAGGGGGGTGTGGEISRDFYNAQGGHVDFNYSTPAGGNGATRCVIQYVTDTSVTTNPVTLPTGFICVGVKYQDDTGYRLWSVTGYFAQGTVVDESQINSTGTLVIYHRVAFGAAPSAPVATIGGTVTLFDSSQRNEDGYLVYDYKWAEGHGESSREYSKAQGGTSAFDPAAPSSGIGAVICTITHFTATSVTTDPTSGPFSFVRVSVDFRIAGGYKIWTVRYAYGSGLVIDETQKVETGALVVYHRVSLGSAPTTPTATIGGTVTAFETEVRNESGYLVYDYRYAEGNGQSSITTDGQQDGALIYTVVTNTAAATTPAYPGSGTAYLVRLSQAPQNGYFRNTAVYQKPPATQTLKQMRNFRMPGLAQFSGNDLIIIPPSDIEIEANVEISYDTTQNADVPYNVLFGAYLRASYIRTHNNSVGEYITESLSYILAGASGISGTAAYYNGALCDSFSATLNSSSPTARPSGLTVIDKDNQIYLVATDGTVVYRRTKVSYTF